MKKTKGQTVFYIFLLTIVPQLAVAAFFLSVCCFAWWAYKYNTFLLWILGLAGILSMYFFFVCVSVWVHSYGLSVFSRGRKEVRYDGYAPQTKKISYRLGRRNEITGEQTVYVRETPAQIGGLMAVMCIQALFVGLTGCFKFLWESFRVLLSRNRQECWESCREYLKQKISEEGYASFFKTPRNCGIVLLAVWVLIFPATMFTSSAYSEDSISFSVAEKENSENNRFRIHTLFYGEVTNNGSKKIEQIEGVVYFRNRAGEALYQGKFVINVPFSTPSFGDEYLESSESWPIVFEVRTDPTHEGAQEIWKLSLEEVEICVDIAEIWFEGSSYLEFPEENIIVIKQLGQ